MSFCQFRSIASYKLFRNKNNKEIFSSSTSSTLECCSHLLLQLAAAATTTEAAHAATAIAAEARDITPIVTVETHFSELPDLRKIKTYTNPT